MATPGNNKQQDSHRDNGIMDSIAALRSVLMLDTPIRNAFAVGRNANARKQHVPKKQLCFSPTTATQATIPESRNISTLTNTPMSRKKPPESAPSEKKSSSYPLFGTPTPSRLPRSPEVQQSATKVLEKKIQLLEASHVELEERLKGEIDQRATLKTTYDKLSEFQTKQSSELEQIRVSRDTSRDESIALKITLERERNNHSRTIAFLKNTISNDIETKRSREKEFFRNEKESLKKQLQKADSRYFESEVLLKSLTSEVDKLNAELKKLRQAHEAAMQKRIDSHAKETAILQDKIVQTESGLVEQINQERKNGEETSEKLQNVLKNRTKLKEDYSSEIEKMKTETTRLQESLKIAADARNESEQKLLKVTDEIARWRQQVNENQLASKEYEEKIKQLVSELDTAKEHLVDRKKLQSEKDELERRLRDTEENSSKLPTSKDQPSIPSEELQSEKRALQQKLKVAEEHRNQFQNELQEAKMELDGLKQNLEEAERIELQNEELVNRLESMSDELAGIENLKERLKVYESDTEKKDQLLRNMELEKVRTKSLNKSDAKSSEIIQNLRQELTKTKEKLAASNEKLGISKLSSLNRLVDVATNREKVRHLEDDLEELEEQLENKLNGENPVDKNDMKRDGEYEELPRKRLKMIDGDQEVDSDDDDDIVL